MNDYQNQANSDAADTVGEYRDEILTQLMEKDEASTDLFNDYDGGDSWHHECHVDKYYDLLDAAELLEELYEHEETDSGLWESQQPREAIGTCAAYTYGNAVYSAWRDLIEEINDDAKYIIDDFDERIDEAEGNDDAIEKLEAEKKEALEVLIEKHC